MALRPLKSFFPTADELLQQDLPTLGGILLTHLKSCEGLNSVYQADCRSASLIVHGLPVGK